MTASSGGPPSGATGVLVQTRVCRGPLSLGGKDGMCKEIEVKNRMGKKRDLFKKIRDTKGTFHEKMGTIKDRNCTDLTEASGFEMAPLIKEPVFSPSYILASSS